MKRAGIAVLVLSMFAFARPANAAAFNFDVTYNGSTASLDPGSDPTSGTSLIPGDSFLLDIHAANNDFWNVTSNTLVGIVASFFVLDSGTRTSNATVTFLLDGVIVATQSNAAQTQQFVHLGWNSFNFTAGMQFDQVLVSNNFTATTSSFTTIQPAADIVQFNFFHNANIAYTQGATAVPEPITGSLVGIGLAAAAGLKRLRRRTAGSR